MWSWKALSDAPAGFLGTLPAESAALGLRFSMPLCGPAKGTTGEPMLFHVECDGRLHIGGCAPDGMDAAALGRQPAAALPHTHDFVRDSDAPRWRVDAGGPGEVDASAVAELLVRTARAADLGDPPSLVLGGEGEWTDPYEVKFYGLGLRSG
ncbi:hypothetical protein [Streptomyces sp. Wb2n-11]|uniref:hypothetical protein n=1 Tax=Streptomyces sp. Wb2n-11 TaxID=1030533 RepID=UPI00114758FE|nr:hypothetical protein [Streptomyces sp. Wb2n-11]